MENMEKHVASQQYADRVKKNSIVWVLAQVVAQSFTQNTYILTTQDCLRWWYVRREELKCYSKLHSHRKLHVKEVHRCNFSSESSKVRNKNWLHLPIKSRMCLSFDTVSYKNKLFAHVFILIFSIVNGKPWNSFHLSCAVGNWFRFELEEGMIRQKWYQSFFICSREIWDGKCIAFA